jgi:para-nitrobenzyl esterase
VTSPSIVEVSGGELLGYTDNGVHTFRGVPYATAERFQRSEPVPAWEGVKPALTYGPTCSQSANDTVSLTEFINFSGANLPQNEQCLYANIWTKSVDAEAKKPVIVWIHGGGYSTGASNELSFYDGRNIAATGDAVFVSVNHRLNVLGYTDLSSYGDEYAASGNLGQLDLVDALAWVNENIDQFGGDPDNVTIIGQSGGGGKVLSLMGMPQAEGLFDRAIAMSPTTTWRDSVAAQAQTDALWAAAGVAPGDVATLSTMPYLELLAAAKEAGFQAGPVTGTEVLPEAPVTPEGTFTDVSSDVPLIVSTVLGEFASNLGNMSYALNPAEPLNAYQPELSDSDIEALLEERYGDRADEVTAAFAKAYPGHEPHEVLWIEDGSFFGGGRVLVSEARAAQGAAPVYTAVTAKMLPVFGGVTPPHTGGDIPFWFLNADKMKHIIAGEEEQFFDLQQTMFGAILAFAQSGDPSTDALDWPEYTAADQSVMVFDTDSEARDHHEVELYKLLAEVRAAS